MTEPSSDRLDRLEALVGELVDRNARLDADNAALRAEVRSLGLAPASTPTHEPTVDVVPVDRSPVVGGAPASAGDESGPGGGVPATVGRRHLLTRGLAAAGAAAAGAVLLDAAPAAAVDGSALVLGSSNVCTSTTSWVQSASTNQVALALSGNGESVASVLSTRVDGVAVRAWTTEAQGTALTVDARKTHLKFVRWDGRVPPIQDTVAHVRGEVVMDAYANLWYCVADGTPGTWRVLAGNGSTGAFFPFAAPLRAYDSRPGSTPALGPKSKVVGTRVLDLKVHGGVYAQANSVMLNILLVNASAGNGNFTVWRDGLAKPQANTLVWGGSTGRFSTLAFTNVSNGKVQVNASMATDLVVDVVGQYY